MRLGLLGPVPRGTDSASLEAAAEFLLQSQKCTRAIYLGDDDALDRMVERRAKKIVGDDPTDDGVWRKALGLVKDGTPEAIDAFIAGERQRRALRVLESLPHPALRTFEMLGDRMGVLIFDKAQLNEEDIFPAAILVYGKNDASLVRKIGTRWFLTPGTLGPQGGICVLEEVGDEIVARFFAQNLAPLHTEHMPYKAAAKLKIQGGT